MLPDVFNLVEGNRLLAHSFAAMRCNNIQERWTCKESGLLMVQKSAEGEKENFETKFILFLMSESYRSKSVMFSLNTLSSNYLPTYPSLNHLLLSNNKRLHSVSSFIGFFKFLRKVVQVIRNSNCLKNGFHVVII